MLPSELLVARRYRDSIRPAYAKLDEENLRFGRNLIGLFESSQGRKRKELWESITELEGASRSDYRYVRGLATLLDRRCLFEAEAVVKPEEARNRLFHAAATVGIPTTLEERREILEGEAKRLGVPVDGLEGSIYADLDEEQILRGFQPLGEADLIRLYNLGQTQTLIFRCSELEFTASGNWQAIFRRIKWLGLIYTIQQREGGYWVRVDGPVSLFRLGDRYGTSLAKLLPSIVEAPEWSIQALILRRMGDTQLLKLELDSLRHRAYLRAEGTSKVESYDSTAEESFAQRFNASRTGWSLTREPTPIPVGRRVMIPDFLLERAGMKVYMEVAGYWTPEYLRRKLDQLRGVEDVDMIVAADADHACQQLDSLGRKLDIIYFKGEVPLRPVLDHLNARESKLGKSQLESLSGRRLEVEGPAVSASKLAQRLGLLEEVVLEELRRREFPGYRLLGDTLISESILRGIGKRLEERVAERPLNLREATELVEELGGVSASRILEHLGYSIEWHGISPEKAKVHRRQVK